MSDWSADLYLRYEDERTRPSRDLLAAVPLTDADRVVDLGCGPGNSTELLVERFPDAAVSGIDSSLAMVDAARKRLPGLTFYRADIAEWSPEPSTNLLFANAVFQWLPNRREVLARLARELSEGGVLAIQMPDNLAEPSHLAMEAVARRGAWAERLANVQREEVGSAESWYDLLKPICRRVDLWRTVYEHPMADAGAIREWFMSTALRPYVSALEPAERDDYLAQYTAEIERHYQPRADGRRLLHFPRLFFVATR